MESPITARQLASLIQSTEVIIAKMQVTHGNAITIGEDPGFLDRLPPRKRKQFKADPEAYALYTDLCDYRDWLAKQQLAIEIAKLAAKTEAFAELNRRLGGIIEEARRVESTQSGSLPGLFNKLEQRGRELLESVGSTFSGEVQGSGRPASPTPMDRPVPSRVQPRPVVNDPALARLDPLDAAAVEVAIPAIKAWEGFRALAYDDQNANVELKRDEDARGTITIGYGTTKYKNGRPVRAGQTITEAKAEELLRAQIISRYLKGAAKVGTWQDLDVNQRASLISFAYNVGPGFYTPGNPNTFGALSDKAGLERWPSVLVTWNKETRGGQKVVNRGLTRRREKELELWNGTGDFASTA